MPKMKSHSGGKTRFKITGSGKVMRRRQNHGHNLSKKSVCRKARISKDAVVSPQDSDSVKQMLGIPIKHG